VVGATHRVWLRAAAVGSRLQLAASGTIRTARLLVWTHNVLLVVIRPRIPHHGWLFLHPRQAELTTDAHLPFNVTLGVLWTAALVVRATHRIWRRAAGVGSRVQLAASFIL
jgi:hypothetical protein